MVLKYNMWVWLWLWGGFGGETDGGVKFAHGGGADRGGELGKGGWVGGGVFKGGLIGGAVIWRQFCQGWCHMRHPILLCEVSWLREINQSDTRGR